MMGDLEKPNGFLARAPETACLRAAARILRDAWGGEAHPANPVVLKDGARCRVLRCSVTDAPGGVSSVIVKQINEQSARGFDEWTSLAFLCGLPNAGRIAPRFYGGDETERLFVMEDFGPGKTLDDLLAGSDVSAARAAPTTLARQMARLHAVSHGKSAAFDKLRDSLPESEGVRQFKEAEIWRADENKILRWFAALKIAPSSEFMVELDAIAHVYREPGGWLAFSHGDPAPTNNHFADGKARLLDFEYGAFRHALYDITAWQILCPLPLDIVSEMRRKFQEELARTLPIARDAAEFDTAWAMLCAFRALALLTWIAPERVIRSDAPWVGEWTARRAVFAAVSRLGRVSAPIARLSGVADAANRLTAALRIQWPEFAGTSDLTPTWLALSR